MRKHSEFSTNFWFVELSGMKRTQQFLVYTTFVVALLSSAFAQEAKAPDVPVLSPQLSAELFKAQHHVDAIAKQRSDKSAQIAQEYSQWLVADRNLDQQEQQARAEFEAAKAKAMTGIDQTKFPLDLETMQPKAVSQPAPTSPAAPPAPHAGQK
jgi:hypothetical protein